MGRYERVALPEGTHVIVSLAKPTGIDESGPVQFPLRKSPNPGSLNLSNQVIAELLDDEVVEIDE